MKTRRINTYLNKSICVLLTLISLATSLLNGCGTNRYEKVPELIEPAAINSSYRPVELGSIGDIEILLGTVVPKQYCCFFYTSVKCTEITVQVGDYVKKGDIVAYSDIEAAKKELDSLQEELEHENRLFDLDEKILVETKNQLEFADSTANIDNQIAVYEENLRYNRLLHQYRVSKLQEEIESVKQVVEDGALRAEHEGYVTYVKNIAYEPNAMALENIVIISDTKDTYIEVAEKTINDYKYGEYENIYIKLAGKKVGVEEISYTSEEMIQSKISGRYPNVRFEIPGGSNMNIGDSCPIYFVKENVENVPIIAKDSIYEENDQEYVYVYKDDNQKEKRKISTGGSDTYYVQVTEGLGLGELVYYESDKRIPSDYNTYRVTLSDFEIENHSKSYKLDNSIAFKYSSKQEGEIKKIAVEEGANVTKGDLLYVVDTGEGKAALTEAENNINRAKKTHVNALEELKIELAEHNNKKDDYSVSQVKILQYQIDRENEEYSYNLKQLQATYDSLGKDNDGWGNVSVYAKDSGVVEDIIFSEGDRVTVGEEIMSLEVASGKKLLVEMREIEKVSVYTDNIADVGENIFIKDGDTTYEGKCTGWTVNSVNNEDKSYVHTEDENVYISFSTSSGYKYPAFYVEMEDTSFYEDMPKERMVTFSYIYINAAITVPQKFIYREMVSQDEECSYVWRVAGDTLIKQYIFVDETLSDEVTAVVLSGLNEGDVLAAEG